MTTFSILFLSKFVILEVVNFVFGDHVELGHSSTSSRSSSP